VLAPKAVQTLLPPVPLLLVLLLLLLLELGVPAAPPAPDPVAGDEEHAKEARPAANGNARAAIQSFTESEVAFMATARS
jgi:hypothetical protein